MIPSKRIPRKPSFMPARKKSASKGMAEREGFEPSVPLTEHDDLANRCLRPLGHLSKDNDANASKRPLQYQNPTPRVKRRRARQTFLDPARPTRRKGIANCAAQGRAVAHRPARGNGKTSRDVRGREARRAERQSAQALAALCVFAEKRRSVRLRGKRNPTGSSECPTKNANNYSTHSPRTQALFLRIKSPPVGLAPIHAGPPQERRHRRRSAERGKRPPRRSCCRRANRRG